MADDKRPLRDYSGRSGFPRGVNAARGAARDFKPPADFRIPPPLRPWVGNERAPGAAAGVPREKAAPERTPA